MELWDLNLIASTKDFNNIDPFNSNYTLPFFDSGFSERCLKIHLDQKTDNASRMMGKIVSQVDLLVENEYLKIEDNVLDVGCGPGLYGNAIHKSKRQITPTYFFVGV